MFDPLVHVGVGALLTREVAGTTEVLLLERGPNATHGANTWGLPGGWIDWGQTPEQAAARELWEELGVVVDVKDGIVDGAVANTYPEQQMHVICIGVRFSAYDTSLLANREPEKCSAVAWKRLDELSSLTLFPPLESLARSWGLI